MTVETSKDDPRFVYCSEEGCKSAVRNHYWGRVKAEGWFFQKDGQAWCPNHIPEWVEEWREGRRRDAERTTR